ncbi:unnamed protein product [Brachionus calyciflorus]|uniref:Uncharacterized protein n=1 Tax=Brachionus calyciflorus TaxID=104777 RepID=A0A814DTK9_9BILA|nr:unnamed protein product [Brachionus calyciflorus]
MDIQLTRLELFNQMKDFLKYESVIFVEKSIEFIKNRYPNNSKIDENIELIRDKLRRFQFKVIEKLNKHSRHINRFLRIESIWLDSKIFEEILKANSEEFFQPESQNSIKKSKTGNLSFYFYLILKKDLYLLILKKYNGLPELSYEQMSKRSKDRVARILANENSNEKLLRSLIKSSKKYRKSLIPLLSQITEPGSASKMTKVLKANSQTPKMLTAETALALISICSLSQDDYQTIRNVTKAHHADIFPSYHKVLKAKKEC